MFVLGNFIAAVAHIIDIALTHLSVDHRHPGGPLLGESDPYNPIVRFITQVTEPVLAPIRRRIPLRGMGIDLSPMIVLLVILFLQHFLVPSLLQLSYHFGDRHGRIAVSVRETGAGAIFRVSRCPRASRKRGGGRPGRGTQAPDHGPPCGGKGQR